jgi:hypothetical protein
VQFNTIILQVTMNTQVFILGYLTALERLKLDIEAIPPMEGGVGKKMLPTITCDAPIIGLALSAEGYQVEIALNYPGKTEAACAASELLKSSMANCHFGAEVDTPLALQVLSKNDKITWFADPTYGLRSLETLTINSSSEWLYFDAYPWMIDTMSKMPLATIPKRGVLINLGTISEENLIQEVRNWRQRFQSKYLVFQASTGQSKISSLHELSKICRAASSQGADAVVITAGKNGLAIARNNCCSVYDCLRIPADKFVDSSGAGAAVSVQLIKMLINDSLDDLDAVAKSLAVAGAKQCLTSGALDNLASERWTNLLQKRGIL